MQTYFTSCFFISNSHEKGHVCCSVNEKKKKVLILVKSALEITQKIGDSLGNSTFQNLT